MHLVYKSKYLRIVETTLKLMFLLFGKSVESQLLETNIMDNYYEDGNNPLQQIIISFNKPIETYSSSILLAAHFRGLAWFMFHWRWTTGALFVVNIMLVEVLLASYVWDVIKSFYVEEIDLDDQDSDNENKTVTEHVDSSSFTSKQLPTNPDESFEIEDGNMFANVDDQSMKHIQQSTIDSRCSDNTEKKQQSLTESLADVQECVQDYSTNANLQTAGSTNTTESQLAYSKPSSEIGGSLAAPASSRNYIKFDNHLITVDDKVPTSIIEPLKPISKSNSVVDEIDLSGLLDQDDEILLQ